MLLAPLSACNDEDPLATAARIPPSLEQAAIEKSALSSPLEGPAFRIVRQSFPFEWRAYVNSGRPATKRRGAMPDRPRGLAKLEADLNYSAPVVILASTDDLQELLRTKLELMQVYRSEAAAMNDGSTKAACRIGLQFYVELTAPPREVGAVTLSQLMVSDLPPPGENPHQ